METYLQGFQEDEQFSTNLLLPNVNGVMKDQHGGLESIKTEQINSWEDECIGNQNTVGKEDFQQIMFDWQQHLGSLQSTENEDLGLNFDTNLDILNANSNNDFFGELESPILSKALKYPGQKCTVNVQPLTKPLAHSVGKDSLLENLGSCVESLESSHKIYGLVKTQPNLIRKITLKNGGKEILGKSIIGLHCLNELKENPDENCQVTSTVINGKRYKIIIKPKSLKVKKLSEEKIRKTLIKKLMQCHLVPKVEPKEDEITSEMCNGNYDVPILNSDLLPSWDFASLDFEWSSQGSFDEDSTVNETETEPARKVPPFKVKVPKLKKHQKKSSIKSDEEIDVESIGDKVVEGHNLSNLLQNFEEEVAKLEKKDSDTGSSWGIADIDKIDDKMCNDASESIKNSLPKEMIERIEALKWRKDCRIPLIQAIPTKKMVKNGTRMQDAVATMNRNKLLKIVSGGDSVQMDHDYCSTFTKGKVTNKQLKKHTRSEVNFSEKNPKKDSGMESGDVSDASEGPNTQESSQNLQSSRQVNNKVLEEHRRVGDHSNVTKAAIAFFRASNAAKVNTNGNTNGSDSVKTKTVSHGNKALTNNLKKSDCNSVNSDTVPSDPNVKNIDADNGSYAVDAESQKNKNGCSVEQCQTSQNVCAEERPKKKLKLEEYLSRRHLKEMEKEKTSNFDSGFETVKNNNCEKSPKSTDAAEAKGKETLIENAKEQLTEQQILSTNVNAIKNESLEKKYWRDRSHRSSSGSSGERYRGERRRSRSKSGSRWRSSSNSGRSRRREGRGTNRYRRSESRETKKRRGVRSGSLSQSSRESSTSSDHSGRTHCRNSSMRYRRRTRSRSVSRGRSRSRNRDLKRRLHGNSYYNRNFSNIRSKSPFYAYSMREKQRQIEERRVIYVGRIEEGMTNAKLRERFSIFGPIIDISLHFREYGDNYGFVTYAYKADAYDAVEHGNDDPSLPRYDLCFGGRRGFCKEKYADLDGMPTSYSGFNDTTFIRNTKDSFDLLLKEAQAKLKNRKKE